MKNLSVAVFTVFAILASGCVCAATTNNTSLHTLLDEIQAWEDSRSPLSELYDGTHIETLPPLKLGDFEQQKREAQNYRAQLLALSATALSNQERLSQQVMAFKLTDFIDRTEFGEHLIPITAEGGFYNSLATLVRRLPFSTSEDYDAYLRWLPQYAEYLLSFKPLLEEGIKTGRVAPTIVVENNLQMLKRLAESSFDENPGMKPFVDLSADGSDANRLLMSNAETVYSKQLKPAYQELYRFFSEVYLPEAPEKPGLLEQPGGAEHYKNRVEFFTTLPLTPDAVFQLGEQEVERIAVEMDEVRDELEFKGTRAQLIAKLRSAPEHYPTSAQALLERAAWIAKTIEGKLPRFFDPLYQLPFTIEPVPASIAPTYTSGRYVSGSREQDRPGIYWVNTTALKSRALFNLPALTLHEAVPGHHLQHALADQLSGVHPFRREYYISAFGEGWGLYAEYLGEEMGIYDTAYERFGRLSYEMWRACRLVVDVGIHYRGWSRQRAIDYLSSRTALSELEVKNEIDRYIGWPGQALAYKAGELTIKGLRREAERHLGEDFDIKAFHRAVLTNGALPLPLLIDQVRTALQLPVTDVPPPM